MKTSEKNQERQKHSIKSKKKNPKKRALHGQGETYKETGEKTHTYTKEDLIKHNEQKAK